MPSPSLGTSLRHPLTKSSVRPSPQSFSNAIYRIPCNDCPQSYVGETGRTIATRVLEHERNIRSHDQGSVTDESENIRRMDWPARSPDLNPIEHVWDALGRRIGARHPSPRTFVELRTALLEEWGLLPLDLLQSLVNSMRARCETLIAFEDAELQALLDEDSTQMQEKLAKQLQESQGAVSLRLNSLGMTQKLSRWTDVVYFELLKPGKMVNTSRYEQQMHSLREALNEKRPEWREKHNNLILQHDNAPAHNATVVKNTIKDLGWEL
ncbi:hypothetical protein LAZ67_1006333 [Cordylochernes scorpioides]|uniref:Transposase n=1 Tax=Cordylochernes scorpioides TaxID=51811 RepID=A0ABY6K3G1_9ARAC|nr:hypothetical protein LAZ67_1006333 [Cordylochernes scorpioides]